LDAVLHVKINKLAIFTGKLGRFFLPKLANFLRFLTAIASKLKDGHPCNLSLIFCRYPIGLLLLAFDEQITQAKLYALLLCYSCLLCANLPLWRD